MTGIELVFAETSPFGSVEAVIEQDDQVAYFYLRGIANDKFGMKSCWIRNLVEAPAELDRQRMAAGSPPTMPSEYCKSVSAQPRLDEKNLRLVWSQEGDGASLLEDDQVIATIPGYIEQNHPSGFQFDGFSIECAKNSPLCGALDDQANSGEIDLADDYWNSWQSENSPWSDYEPQILTAYESIFGPTVNYFSIDGGHWPPRTLARYQWEGRVVLATVGVSICRQPGIAQFIENPSSLRRFEWAACFESDLPEDLISEFGRYLSGQVVIPWQHQVFFAHGHSVSCEFFQNSPTLPDYSSILLYQNQQCSLSTESEGRWSGLPNVLGDPVNLYWSLPVFEKERKYIQETNNYSFADELVSEDGLPVIRNRASRI